MRAVRGVPSMRHELAARVVIGELARASEKGFRVLHFSVQADHVHLVAEADDAACFSRGMQRLASRIAMSMNALVSRHGRFWRERYFREDLATPRQFRNALVYVTFNFRKHARGDERAARERKIDRFSSGLWFDEWSSDALVAQLRAIRAGPSPVVRPASWIARVGWKKHGLLNASECPVSSA
jgi:putative transposase